MYLFGFKRNIKVLFLFNNYSGPAHLTFYALQTRFFPIQALIKVPPQHMATDIQRRFKL